MLDPIGGVPIFLTMTEEHASSRHKIAIGASVTVLTVLICAAFFGEQALKLFGISLNSFRVIGGILLLILALDMLNARMSRAKSTPEEQHEAVSSRRELSIVPLGTPLLAGPGAMSSAIIFMTEARGFGQGHQIGIVLMILAASAITLLTLLFATWLGPRLGRTALNVMKRLMGLILGAIAIEFIVGGLRAMLPGLAG